MLQLTKKQIQDFQKKILSWYAENQRDLPWRKTRDPYKILVSEIMSQQTQLSRVVPKYLAWLEVFPTVEVLAQAERSEVLRLWSGLGYNRRALYLQRTAQTLVERKNTVMGNRDAIIGERKEKIEDRRWEIDNQLWPRTVEELKKLPGIGEYTARAVACFAFNQQIPIIDTNIRKVMLTQIVPVISHFVGEDKQEEKNLKLTEKEILLIAEQLLPDGNAYAWNQALMDYAAGVLKKEKIPIAKQSKFLGSNRYFRGKTLRLLLEKKQLRREQLGPLLKSGFVSTDQEWVETLITGLLEDGLVREENGVLFL